VIESGTADIGCGKEPKAPKKNLLSVTQRERGSCIKSIKSREINK